MGWYGINLLIDWYGINLLMGWHGMNRIHFERGIRYNFYIRKILRLKVEKDFDLALDTDTTFFKNIFNAGKPGY